MKNRLLARFALFTLATMAAFGADVTGKWQAGTEARRGLTFNFTQSGSKVTGTVEGGPTPMKSKTAKSMAISSPSSSSASYKAR